MQEMDVTLTAPQVHVSDYCHYGILLTSISTFFCFALSAYLKNCRFIPLHLRKSSFETWYWSSYIVSFLHAFVIGVGAFFCAFVDRRLLFEIHHFNELAYCVICMSTGYFIYDLIDEIRHKNETAVAQYVVHHVLALIILIPCMVTQRFTGIASAGLITEVHNIFLHSRIILTFYGYDHDEILKNSFGVANLLTCIVFRLVLFPWMAYVVSMSSVATPIEIIFYLELFYIFLYSLYIFKLSLDTDFPSIKAC